jgi:hypothetical protein
VASACFVEVSQGGGFEAERTIFAAA